MCAGAASPSGSEEAVDVGEGGAELLEVAVQRRSETLEGNPEMPIKRLEHRHRQRPLQTRPLVGAAAEHHLDTQRHAAG